jgi:hypothetical protein
MAASAAFSKVCDKTVPSLPDAAGTGFGEEEIAARFLSLPRR